MGGFEATYSLFGKGVALANGPSAPGIAMWFLAGVFAISGIAKLRRPILAAGALVDFRVVHALQPRLGWALGAGETSLFGLLALGAVIHGRLQFASALLATVLLLIFVYLIFRSLLADDDFSCFCFGESDTTLSWWTLVRTFSLALVGCGVIAASGWRNLSVDINQSMIQAVAAAALLSIITLMRRVPVLVEWNDDTSTWPWTTPR